MQSQEINDLGRINFNDNHSPPLRKSNNINNHLGNNNNNNNNYYNIPSIDENNQLIDEEEEEEAEVRNEVSEVQRLLKEYPSITWIDINQIDRGQRIGLGASAEVRKGMYNGTPIAIKVYTI
jgi:hypothetical protein